MSTEMKAVLGAIITGVAAGLWWFFQQYWLRKANRKRLVYQVRCAPVAKRTTLKKELQDLGLAEHVTPDSAVAELVLTNKTGETVHSLNGKFLVKDAVFVTPGWMPNVPNGFEQVWEITQGQDRLVLVELEYINPNQAFTARFLLDKMPPTNPSLIMAAPGFTLECQT